MTPFHPFIDLLSLVPDGGHDGSDSHFYYLGQTLATCEGFAK